MRFACEGAPHMWQLKSWPKRDQSNRKRFLASLGHIHAAGRTRNEAYWKVMDRASSIRPNVTNWNSFLLKMKDKAASLRWKKEQESRHFLHLHEQDLRAKKYQEFMLRNGRQPINDEELNSQ